MVEYDEQDGVATITINEPDRRNPRYVQTVFGAGYRFAVPPAEES